MDIGIPHIPLPQSSSEKRPVVWQDLVAIVDPHINAAGVHVWSFDPAFPVDIRYFRATYPHNIRMNRHSYCEVIHICRGETTFTIHDRQIRALQGDLVVIGTQIFHGVTSQMTVDKAVLFFEPEIVTAAMSPDEHQFLTPFFHQPAGFPHVIPAATGVPKVALQLMRGVYQELGSTSPLARLSARTLLKMLLMLLVRHYAPYLEQQDGALRRSVLLDRFNPLFSHIEDHYGETIHIAEAAKLCNMSQSHMMSLFREATGQSFINYLTRFRIAKAQDLLARTDASLAEISQRVGFCSQSHFGQVFRRLIGETPNEYRLRTTGAVRLHAPGSQYPHGQNTLQARGRASMGAAAPRLRPGLSGAYERAAPPPEAPSGPTAV